ncbi:MAG: phosphoenolpyruvate-dependent sugar phosphotransferase system, 2 family protein [Firmicutes bacterium]|nr:phosphoenolpyruvate-dependent sugar phosphotransferase system, 2 family protein [Bacillota bacterium]
MLKELVDQNRVTFARCFGTWEDAVAAAAKPLLEQKAIEQEYVTAIIDSIKKYGPYIVIAPNIALPHAQGGIGVKETSISFLKVEEPVHFSDDPEHDARLIFLLASVNSEDHLEKLAELVEEISDNDLVERLLTIKNIDDLKEILQ